MKKTILSALLITAAPFAAQAETITGGLTLSYTKHSNGSDMTTVGLDGRLGVAMDNGLHIDLDLGHATMTPDGAPFDFTAEFYSIEVGYDIGNGIRAGVFADRLTMGVDLVPFDFTLKTNGVMLAYEGNGFSGEAFVGNTSANLLIPFSNDIRNYGVSGHYTGLADWDIGAAFHRSHISSGPLSEDLDFFGVAATYMVNDSLMLFAGASSLDIGIGSSSIDAVGLGASYGLGDTMGFASSVSLEVGRTSQGSSDLDVIRLGLTIPLGKAGPALPMNSVADAILHPRHGAFNAGMTAGF